MAYGEYKKVTDLCKCGSKLSIRKNSRTGNFFLGCASYPVCKEAYFVDGMSKKEVESLYNKPVKRKLTNVELDASIPF